MSDLQPLVRSNGTLYEDIWHYTGVSQKVSCDRGDNMLLKPGLYGSLLIGVPICSNDWLHHQHLQAIKCLCALSITKLKENASLVDKQASKDHHKNNKGLLIWTGYGSSVAFNALKSSSQKQLFIWQQRTSYMHTVMLALLLIICVPKEYCCAPRCPTTLDSLTISKVCETILRLLSSMSPYAFV